jgi:hypothetical protein
MSWLSWRNRRLLFRNRLRTRVKLIVTVIMALTLGGIYFDLPNTLSGINDRAFFMLNTAILVGMDPLVDRRAPIFPSFFRSRPCAGVRISIETIRFFQREKHVVLRQAEQGLFGAGPYVSSRILVETPNFLLLPLVFCAIAFPMVNFQVGRSSVHGAAGTGTNPGMHGTPA